MAVKVFLVLLVSIFSIKAFCGYDKTEWGMPIKKIQSLYPHGNLVTTEGAGKGYWIIREIAGYPNVITQFKFNEEGKLSEVLLTFPNKKIKTISDFRKYSLKDALLKQQEAKEVHTDLLQKLLYLYGKADSSSGLGVTIWFPKNGESVGLVLMPEKKDMVLVGVMYNPVKTLEEDLKGL